MVDKYTIPKNPIQSPPGKGLYRRLPEYPSGNNSENQRSITTNPEDKIRDQMKEDRDRRDQNRSMIHDAFPPMGSVQPSYLGSQSDTPDNGD
jgi:hypothetical protein